MSPKRTRLAAVIGLAILAACTPGRQPGDQEEVPTKTEDVPAVVRAAADRFCGRLGRAEVTAWFWDLEDKVWEGTVSGLSRRAEIDITPDGGFSELELVYDLAEVEKTLPEVGEFIRAKSHNEVLLIELSLRREEYLDDVPALKEAWSKNGVVLEFQCADGRDVEVDARRMVHTKPVDDMSDPRDAPGK